MRKRYLSTNIVYLKKKKSLSRTKLSYLSQVSVEIIANIEKGLTANPNMLTIARIAKGLDVSVDDLIYKDFRKDDDYEYMDVYIDNANNWFLAKNINNYLTKNSVISLCDKAKINATLVHLFLKSGKVSARLETVEKIANLFEVTIDQLLFGEIKFN